MQHLSVSGVCLGQLIHTSHAYTNTHMYKYIRDTNAMPAVHIQICVHMCVCLVCNVCKGVKSFQKRQHYIHEIKENSCQDRKKIIRMERGGTTRNKIELLTFKFWKKSNERKKKSNEFKNMHTFYKP